MARTKKMIDEIIKNAIYATPNKALHGAWVENGCQYCTDGYRAVMLYEPVEAKERDNDCTLSVHKLITDAEMECTETVTLPNAKEIREQLKNLIGRKYRSYGLLYRLADDYNLASVNAKYLVECMEAIGATELRYNPKRPKNSALYMETKLGKAILLPVYNTTEKVGYWSIAI